MSWIWGRCWRRGESDFSGEDPRVLIIHTHATESYTIEPGWEYTASSDYWTLDPRYNMIR